MRPGSNRVVNAIRYCLLWVTLDDVGEGGERRKHAVKLGAALPMSGLLQKGTEAVTRCSEAEQKVQHTGNAI